MGGAGDARFFVGEQHRGAVGGEDAERDAFLCRHHRIHLGRFLAPPGPLDPGHENAVSLIGGYEPPRIEACGGDRAIPVLRHPGRIVAGAEAAIERGVQPFADAALTAEKAVAKAGEFGKRLGLDHGGGGHV